MTTMRLHVASVAVIMSESSFATVNGRRALLDINLKEVRVASDCNLDEVAKLTDGYSGADITNVCRWVARLYSCGVPNHVHAKRNCVLLSRV